MDDSFFDNIFPMFDNDGGEGFPAVGGAVLERYTTDLTEEFSERRAKKVIGRERELERIIEVLTRKTKNNPVLVGESGVGKTSIVESLAYAIVHQNVPASMLKKRILSLNLNSIVAGSVYRGEFEGRLDGLINELKANKNIILFIDELHTILGAGNSKGELDAAAILKTPLSKGEIQIIGATTTKEFSQYIEKAPGLARRFQKIDIKEPSDEETVNILEGVKSQYESYHHVQYTSDAIPSIVRLSKRYLTEQFFPDKAIDLLDEAGAKVSLGKSDVVAQIERMKIQIDLLKEQKRDAVDAQVFEEAATLRDKIAKLDDKIATLKLKNKGALKVAYQVTGLDVAKVVSRMTGIPLDELSASESDRLINMESEIHKSIISQDEAVKAVSSAVRRNKAGISSDKRPLGSFLFLGPTGVGKTQLAKTLAKFIFGKEEALLRVDMSDYNESSSVTRLVGSAPGYVGYEEGGILTNYVREHPYSIILLDEIEKANQSIFNLLLQMLEEGQLNDKLGHTVNFRNTIVIMTSNAGSRAITNDGRVGFGTGSGLMSTKEIKANALNELKKLMNPEIVNRIDEIVVFNPLTKDDIVKILDLQLDDLKIRLEKRGYTLEVTQEAKAYLEEKGYDPSLGARPMRRLIQKELEDPLSLMILDRNNAGKTHIVADYKGGEVVITALPPTVIKELGGQAIYALGCSARGADGNKRAGKKLYKNI